MIPVTATLTKIENETYRHMNATDEAFDAIIKFYQQVLDEDKKLCDEAQKNLNNGIYITGELHPEKEKVRSLGVLSLVVQQVFLTHMNRVHCLFKIRFAKRLWNTVGERKNSGLKYGRQCQNQPVKWQHLS